MESRDAMGRSIREFEEPRSRLVQGFLLGLLLQVLSFPLAVLVSALSGNEDFAWEYVYTFLGIAQLVYMVPVIVLAFSKGHRRLAKGLTIAAALVALLNAACWGIVTTLQF